MKKQGIDAQVNPGARELAPAVFPYKPLAFDHEKDFVEAVGLRDFRNVQLLMQCVYSAIRAEGKQSKAVEVVEKIILQADPEMVRFIVSDYIQMYSLIAKRASADINALLAAVGSRSH